ncbi:MAG TPA: hypothetical protein DCZ01_11030 [Elusimicrobia bacterium]|nr:MAG: hypothetical protein A2X37_02020 [Elusimicrobia bacterium GWA2_66_18]HAZ09024.1 hypothetical protein [Elusimicrobiota bacterium]
MKTALLFAALLAAALAPASAAAAPPRGEAVLAAFGASLVEDADGLAAAGVRPDSPAAAAGLRPADRILRAAQAAARTRAEAAAALRAVGPESRESLVVRRGLAALPLIDAQSPQPLDFSRGARDLSAREWTLAQARGAQGSAQARDEVAEEAPLDWTLRADQALWVRFPAGLPSGLKKGAVVAAETAAALTTDGSLDFLAVPSKSPVWARVAEAADDGAVRSVRLLFFKMRPAGAGVYPILGAATALAGVEAPDLSRVSAGGTLVVAAPLPSSEGGKHRGPDLLLDEDARLRVRLLEPITIVEPPSWWRAGPGLWIKTVEADGRRRFEITHAIAGRAAEAAGLKPGDVLDAVAGRSTERLNFADALDALYGAPGSTVRVSVLREGKSVALDLQRGVRFEKGAATPLAPPFEAR